MTRSTTVILALLTLGSLVPTGVAQAQNRNRTTSARSVEQRYGIQGTYDSTTLHPKGRRSTAVPVTLEDGRTGELVIPSGNSDANVVYFRDDETGDLHPVRMDTHVTRQQLVQAPTAARFQKVPKRGKTPSWQKDALIVGGSAGGGALIGAAAGGAKGAGVGAVAGGVGGLIYDLLSRNKR